VGAAGILNVQIILEKEVMNNGRLEMEDKNYGTVAHSCGGIYGCNSVDFVKKINLLHLAC